MCRRDMKISDIKDILVRVTVDGILKEWTGLNQAERRCKPEKDSHRGKTLYITHHIKQILRKNPLDINIDRLRMTTHGIENRSATIGAFQVTFATK